MPQPLSFEFPNKIIEVPIPDVELDLQYLINQIREAEDDITPGMAYSKIADAFGKQDLGGGVQVGLTVVLLDGWRVRFEARPPSTYISVRISGGNFVGEAGANPVAPSAYTQVTVAQSSSATIITPDSDTNLVYLVESLRNSHPAFGNVWYWDPHGGLDTNGGTTPSTSVKTFAAAHDLATNGNNDVIFCRPTDSTGTTVIAENLNISKANLKVRGPGLNAKIIPTGTTSPTVNIAADNVEFSGFYLETAATGGQNAVTVTGNNVLIRDCWINNIQNHGVHVSASARLRVLTSVIENSIGNGINLYTNTTQALISKCIINNNSNGIKLSSTGVNDNVIENCLIYKNSLIGVDIAASTVNRTTLRGANTITRNSGGNTNNSGTDTTIETPAGGASETDIAAAVWNEVIASHTTAGTAGKVLKDAKTKATLASLK